MTPDAERVFYSSSVHDEREIEAVWPLVERLRERAEGVSAAA